MFAPPLFALILAQTGDLLPVGGVADPPPPQVRIQVRTPAAVAKDKPIPYKLVVTNPSTERAYKVRLRAPKPAGVSVGKMDPPSTSGPADKELAWDIGELPGGAQKVIELELKPNPGVGDVKFQAFVTSEYGQSVLTKVEAPKLKVEKRAAKQAAAGEPVPVEVAVTNTGAVNVLDVKLTETVSDGFRVDDRAAGGLVSRKGGKPEQRVWELGTLRPGETKRVRYEVKEGAAGKLVTTSAADGHGVTAEVPPETVTEVLSTGLTVELAGTPTVPGGQRGKYTVVARNTGGLPLTNVKLSANLPAGVTLKKVTNGGQRYKDTVEWTLDRLDAGDAYSVRFELDSTTSGKKLIRVGAKAGKVEAAGREATSTFEGTALLGLRGDADPAMPAVGSQGMLTFTVSNSGSEPARNARLRVEIPDGVTVVQTTPKDVQQTKNEVLFPVATVAAGEPVRYTLTYRADKVATVFFRATLEASSLTERPLTKDQSVEIVPK